MIGSELLAAKTQQVLGAQYLVSPFHLFTKRYTNVKKIQNGIAYDINYQAFEEKAHVIPVRVTATEINPTASPLTAKTYNYEMIFDIPLNSRKTDENGKLIELPEFNFFGDCERLKATLAGNELEFFDGADKYRAFTTMSEPVYYGKEVSGSYSRELYRIIGNMIISEPAIGIGNDYRVALVFKNEQGSYREFFFDNISEFAVGASIDSNASELTDKMSTELHPAVKGQDISFSVSDIVIAADYGLSVVKDKIFKNIEVLSPNETDAVKSKLVLVRLYCKDVILSQFWATLAAEFNVAGVATYPSYKISLTNAGIGG